MNYFDVPTTNWGNVCVPDVKPDDEILMWADMISDRMRMDELCGLLMAFRGWSYDRGYLDALRSEGSVVEGPVGSTEGGARAAGAAGEVQGVSGRSEQSTTRFRGYEKEVETRDRYFVD